MKIDLHIHSSYSDGKYSVEDILNEARNRKIDLLSITDHDSLNSQLEAKAIADKLNIKYISGIELNVTFQYNEGILFDSSHQKSSEKTVSLDFLGYCYDIENKDLRNKLELIRNHRENRAKQILENLNNEFDKENIDRLTEEDMTRIQESVDGVFGRPHIADYLIKKGIVGNRQEAFDRYLIRCNVPKYPLSLAEASKLIGNAGGILVLAHPNDPNGTSLSSISHDLYEQTSIIEEYMLEYIDGIECWHSRHDTETTRHYLDFTKNHGLLETGGSDCHQNPVIMGTLDIPDYVAEQFQL